MESNLTMDSYIKNDNEFSSPDAPPPVLIPDGKLQMLSESVEQTPASPTLAHESEENQITITIMDNGDVQIMDTEKKIFLIKQTVLLAENIDTNDLTDDSIRKLIQMAIPSSNTESQPQKKQDGRKSSTVGRKRRAKALFDPSTSVIDNQSVNNNKRKMRKQSRSIITDNCPTHTNDAFNNAICLNNDSSKSRRNSATKVPLTSAINDAFKATDDSAAQKLASLTKFNGVKIYKPTTLATANQVESQEQQQSSGSSIQGGPRFCCAVCDKPIPKTKVDFILLRLPAHTYCAKNTMMVLSDEEGDDSNHSNTNI